MILGTGIDLVEISRIEESLKKFGDRFEERIFTRQERAYCRQCARPAMHFAVRFAAKEAFLKALGTGMSQGISWKEIEILKDSAGCPSIQLSGRAKELAEALGSCALNVSLSHVRSHAIAFVLLHS